MSRTGFAQKRCVELCVLWSCPPHSRHVPDTVPDTFFGQSLPDDLLRPDNRDAKAYMVVTPIRLEP